jgi:hypothetical protein
VGDHLGIPPVVCFCLFLPFLVILIIKHARCNYTTTGSGHELSPNNIGVERYFILADSIPDVIAGFWI